MKKYVDKLIKEQKQQLENLEQTTIKNLKEELKPISSVFNQVDSDKFNNSKILITTAHRAMVTKFLKDYRQNFAVVLIFQATRDGWSTE